MDFDFNNGSAKLGSSFVNQVKKTFSQVYGAVKDAAPIVNQVEEFYSGSNEREKQRLKNRGFTEQQITTTQQNDQKYLKTNDATSQLVDTISDKTNVAKPLIQAGVFSVEFGLDALTGRAMGNRSLQGLSRAPAPAAQALTIKNPDFIARGVQQGIASGPDFGPAMRQWNARRNELIDQRRYPQGPTVDRRLKNQRKSLVTAYNDVSTGPTTDPLDVEAYGSTKFKVKGKEQHHLFPKQESYQFVERMKKIGDDDDVLNLFLYAEELDATMGGRLSNMLNMDKKPHNNLHGNRLKDGRELRGMKMKNLVASAKSSDELMKLFDSYIMDNIKPSKAEAIVLQKAFDSARSNLNKFKSLSEDARRRL